MIHKKILNSREEWLENRKLYIGGSEASAIVGCNPYMSNIDLWEIKTGRKEQDDISDKPYVVYGTKAEEHLRELFKLDFPQYEVEYEENNSFVNDRYPWAAASLDGLLIEKETGRKGILEIKTTNILQSMQKEKWNNRLPDNYFVQTLHYMAVLEAEFCILKAHLRSDFGDVPYIQTKHYMIEVGEVVEDIVYLMYEEEKFWRCVTKDQRPALILPGI